MGTDISHSRRKLAGNSAGPFHLLFPVRPKLGSEVEFHAKPNQFSDGLSGLGRKLAEGFELLLGQLHLGPHHAIMIAVSPS
jgi:hypothetical protein